MITQTASEFFVLDRHKWKEVPDKYVLKSGYIYLGHRFIGKEFGSVSKVL
jgi:hypothetical protein